MDKTPPAKPVICFVGAGELPVRDPYLAKQGLSSGMMFFSIPAFGVQFKCRVSGSLIELEFAAFLSLLKTIKDSLADQKIKSIHVFSANPEFVFAFTGKSRHLVKGSERERLIKEYGKGLQMAVSLIPLRQNKALASPADYPSLPDGVETRMKPNLSDQLRGTIKPFQTGIKL